HPLDDDIPASLPAVARAAKVQRRAAGSGFDWRSVEGAAGKVHEELVELEREVAGGAAAERIEEELGDLLFAIAALGRRLDVDPETALRKATRRFGDRFERMREQAARDGVSLEDLTEDDLLARFRAAH